MQHCAVHILFISGTAAQHGIMQASLLTVRIVQTHTPQGAASQHVQRQAGGARGEAGAGQIDVAHQHARVHINLQQSGAKREIRR